MIAASIPASTCGRFLLIIPESGTKGKSRIEENPFFLKAEAGGRLPGKSDTVGGAFR
jgi:hypothetical protein